MSNPANIEELLVLQEIRAELGDNGKMNHSELVACISALVQDAERLARVVHAWDAVKPQIEAAYEHWDKDNDAKVGKHLLALLGERKHYAREYAELHAAIDAARGAGGGGRD